MRHLARLAALLTVFVITAAAAHAKAQESAVKALDSFRLLTQADVEAAKQKKIDEATPEPLPQAPAVRRPKSDAEDEGLKGRVKIVVTETQDLSGTWAVGGRKPSATDYYDEGGQLTKRVLYDYKGNLSEVALYGYLDGERVRNGKSVSYEYDPPPMMMPAAPAGQPAPKRDPRYSWKFKYKYDERGRLVEEDWYSNDGKLWLRYVYKYEGDKKEELVYSEDGSLNQHYLYTLDGKGNEVEEIDYDVRGGSVSERQSFSYELDPKGNWTKKTTSKWVTKDGREQLAPEYVTYRTITYY
jgi:YD repeat-containing protein